MNRDVKVCGLMTAPRYECTASRNVIERALRELGIPLNVSGGVYYGQCMQKMLEQLLTIDCDYAVTVDGDSLFTAKQLHRMISIVVQEDSIDALAALQMRRGKPDLLATKEGEREIHWTGQPVQVTTAHFGLTVIDLAKLQQVAKPWFWAKPNDAGEWEEGKIDDDVFFWHQWKEAGNSIYIDPGTRIGHIEEMVSTYDEQLRPVHVYFPDWQEMNSGS